MYNKGSNADQQDLFALIHEPSDQRSAMYSGARETRFTRKRRAKRGRNRDGVTEGERERESKLRRREIKMKRGKKRCRDTRAKEGSRRHGERRKESGALREKKKRWR